MIGAIFAQWVEETQLRLVHFARITFPAAIVEIVEFMNEHFISLIVGIVLVVAFYAFMIRIGYLEHKKVEGPWEKEEKRAAKKLQRQKEKERRARSQFFK